MAQDFLSQEEVDALLKGVTGEADEPEQEKESGGVQKYDVGRQERIVRGRMPTMELINERFARYLRIGLFNYMHRTTEISLGPIRVQKYSEFIRNLVVPTNLNIVSAKPMRGNALVIFAPNLVFTVVDNMFGGDSRFTPFGGPHPSASASSTLVSMTSVMHHSHPLRPLGRECRSRALSGGRAPVLPGRAQLAVRRPVRTSGSTSAPGRGRCARRPRRSPWSSGRGTAPCARRPSSRS